MCIKIREPREGPKRLPVTAIYKLKIYKQNDPMHLLSVHFWNFRQLQEERILDFAWPNFSFNKGHERSIFAPSHANPVFSFFLFFRRTDVKVFSFFFFFF